GIRRLLGSVSWSTRSAGDQARRLRFELSGFGKVFVAAGYSSAAERMGGRFCVGGASGARWTGARFAHGDVPDVLSGTVAVRYRAAFSRAERNELGEVERRCAPALRAGIAAATNVSAAKVF